MSRAARLLTAALVTLCVAPLSLSGVVQVASASSVGCHAPRFTGLTVTEARTAATKAGCHVRFNGARVATPMVQTIRHQSVRPGRWTTVVTLSVNPFCSGAAAPGPPAGEPIINPGPTELVTGLFIEGGAYMEWSAPSCTARVGKSSPGTITVTNSEGTVIVDNSAVSAGQLLTVTVTPGVYTLTGVFSGGTRAGPIHVTVPAGDVVRQDLVLDVP